MSKMIEDEEIKNKKMSTCKKTHNILDQCWPPTLAALWLAVTTLAFNIWLCTNTFILELKMWGFMTRKEDVKEVEHIGYLNSSLKWFVGPEVFVTPSRKPKIGVLPNFSCKYLSKPIEGWILLVTYKCLPCLQWPKARCRLGLRRLGAIWRYYFD